ncbi:hypothetical protein BGW80DRAFT_1283147, partial [Lactifluus volemus]
IVISSDEEEDPRPAPPRGLRKPRRSKRQEVLEVLDDTPVKHEEETETEKLRRQCHELEQERDMLQNDNRRLSSTVDQLKASTTGRMLNMSALDEAVCCEICTHTMWSPYLLTNCGHTFCQGCLNDWLNTTLSQHRQNSTRGSPAYTCPSCRHAIHTPPVQNFSLKRIVQLAAESRGDSSPRRPQRPSPPVRQQPRGRGGPRRDFPPGPFDDYFRSWR